MFELVEPEPCRYTQAVSTARKEIWSFLDSIQVSLNTNRDGRTLTRLEHRLGGGACMI